MLFSQVIFISALIFFILLIVSPVVTVPQCAPLGGAWYEKEESEPGEEQENAESGKQHERTLIQTRGTF